LKQKKPKGGHVLFHYMRARQSFKSIVERPLSTHDLIELIGPRQRRV
jgi:hypothetical protein